MTPAEWSQLQEFFHAAVDGDEDQRREALRAAAADGCRLEQQLRSLLDAHAREAKLLESPAGQRGAEVPVHQQNIGMLRKIITTPGFFFIANNAFFRDEE